MFLALFDDMAQAIPQEVERLLPMVSEQRREEALKYKHTFGQFACVKSYIMLRQLIIDNNLAPDDAELIFERNEHGKPALCDFPNIHFNISHCPQAIAVVVDDRPIGVDVERFTSPSDSLLKYCMSEAEVQAVRQSPHPDQYFTQLWTCKEAYVKWLGSGITSEIKELLAKVPDAVEFTTTLHRSYACTIARTR